MLCDVLAALKYSALVRKRKSVYVACLSIYMMFSSRSHNITKIRDNGVRIKYIF